MLLGVTPVTDWLLFFRPIFPLADGRYGVNGALCVSYWRPISTTPYSVMPCHVRASSPVTPGPVFCCASAGTEAATALNKINPHHPRPKSLKPVEDGCDAGAGQLRPDRRVLLVRFISFPSSLIGVF